MGRRNKAYFKDLHQQAYDRLTGMQAFGESKKEAVANGTEKDKIFAFNTYKSYWKHTKYFIKYIKEKHPECTTLKSAKKYANEWLQARTDQGLSAWTVQLEAKALGKLYGISPDDESYFKPPKRNREEIKRSRGDRVRDQHFSKTNNDELIKFCRGTGLRRKELQELRGKDLVPRAQIEAEISELQKIPEEQRAPSVTKRLEMLQDARLFPEEWFIHVRNGKGGRERLSPIIGKNAGQIIERITDTPSEEKVWQHVHNCADIHGYRAEYGTGKYMRRVLLWETVIQSPYGVDLPEELVRKQVTEELTCEGATENSLIHRIGIDDFYPGSYAAMMKNRNKRPWYEIPEETDEPEEHKEENIMLLPHFRANFKTGYWEAVISHTRPLGVVPWDMRG